MLSLGKLVQVWYFPQNTCANQNGITKMTIQTQLTTDQQNLIVYLNHFSYHRIVPVVLQRCILLDLRGNQRLAIDCSQFRTILAGGSPHLEKTAQWLWNCNWQVFKY